MARDCFVIMPFSNTVSCTEDEWTLKNVPKVIIGCLYAAKLCEIIDNLEIKYYQVAPRKVMAHD